MEAADHVKNIRAEVRYRRVGDTSCFLSIVGGLRKQKMDSGRIGIADT